MIEVSSEKGTVAFERRATCSSRLPGASSRCRASGHYLSAHVKGLAWLSHHRIGGDCVWKREKTYRADGYRKMRSLQNCDCGQRLRGAGGLGHSIFAIFFENQRTPSNPQSSSHIRSPYDNSRLQTGQTTSLHPRKPLEMIYIHIKHPHNGHLIPLRFHHQQQHRQQDPLLLHRAQAEGVGEEGPGYHSPRKARAGRGRVRHHSHVHSSIGASNMNVSQPRAPTDAGEEEDEDGER